MTSTAIYKGKKIITWELDSSTFQADIAKVNGILDTYQKGTALVMMDFSNTKFNPDLMASMKDIVSGGLHPAIKVMASVGVEGLKQIFVSSLDKVLTDGNKPTLFETTDDAKEWLIAQ